MSEFEKRLESVQHGRSVRRALVLDDPESARRLPREFIAFDSSPEAIALAWWFRPLHLGNGDHFLRNEDGTYTFVHHCGACVLEARDARWMRDQGDEA